MSRSDDWIDPPNTFMVGDERPILYRADGTPLKRQIGFAMQTRDTFPQTNQGKKTPKKGGKKGGC